MSILNLPNELLYMIAKDLDLQDINSLLKTSWQLAFVLTPLLQHFSVQEKHSMAALFCAASNRNEPMVRLLLNKGANIGVFQDNRGETELVHRAPARCSEEVVKAVMDQGANLLLELPGGTGQAIPALHWAIRQGHKSMIGLLIEQGAKLDCQYGSHVLSGPAAIHEAAQCSDEETMQLLLSKGVDCNAQTHRGLTPLHITAMNGHLAGARLLLQHQAQTTIVDRYGFTAMLVAEENSAKDIARLLLDTVNPVTFKDQHDRTAFHLAALYSHHELVRSLLVNGADINSKDASGKTPFHFAATEGDEAVAMLLLDNGADIHVSDNSGATALHYAAGKDKFPMVQLLVQRGANINSKDMNGKTALHLAASQGARGVANFLLRKGANIMVQDTCGQSALHMVGQYWLKLVSERTKCH